MAFGEIAQYPEGTTYIDRAALRAAGVHVRSGVESPARALLEASQSSSRAATKTTVTTATSSSIQAPVVGAKAAAKWSTRH
jgi:hypothetical protein